MSSVYSDRLSGLEAGQEDTLEATITEEIVQQDEDGTGVILHETIEVQGSDVPSIESSSDEEESFSVRKFLGRLSINLILPFINGLMLGFGEIIAHEIGFHYNWTGSKVYPQRRMLEKDTKLL